MILQQWTRSFVVDLMVDLAYMLGPSTEVSDILFYSYLTCKEHSSIEERTFFEIPVLLPTEH